MWVDEVAQTRTTRGRPDARTLSERPGVFNVRLCAEILAIVASVLAAIMLLLPELTPGENRAVDKLLGPAMLAFTVGLLLLWRLSAAATRTLEGSGGVTTEMGERLRRSSRLTVAAYLVVLVAGLGCSLLGASRIYEEIHAFDKAGFERDTDRVKAEIENRLKGHRLVIHALRGLYDASKSVERGEFRVFFAPEDVTAEIPGAYGFGFIERVPRVGLDEFIAAERADGAPDFSVRTSGDLPDLYVTKFVEPLESQRSVEGYDIGSEPRLREAADRAMLSGEATISGLVVLHQDERKRPGYLYLLAVYRNAGRPVTPEQRRRELVGWTYASLVIEEALAGVTDAAGERLDATIYDRNEPTRRSTIYESARSLDGTPAADAEHGDPPTRAFEDQSVITVGEREWTLWLGSISRLDADHRLSALAETGGALVSVLLALLTWGLGSGRARAIAVAAEMTKHLRERDESARATLASLESYREALNQQVIIAATDVTGRITEVNEPFCRISGFRRAELIGANHRIINSGRHLQAFWVEMWRTVTNGGLWRAEVCNKTKDGKLYWVDTTIGPVRNAAREITGYIAVRVDISDRKRAELAVAESEAKFRTLAEGTGVILWQFDVVSDAFTYVSPQAASLGYPLEEWLKPGFWEACIHPEDRERVVSFCREEMLAGLDHRMQYRMLKADGGVVWVDDVVTVTRLGSGETMVRGVLIDVTELQHQSEELGHALDAAEAASRAKSEFLANMSHEIRTPMTAILGYADLLREDGDVAKAPLRRLEMIDAINGASSHLMRVIDDILDLSKIEANRMAIERIETPLLHLLSDVAGLVRPRAADKGLALSLRLDTPLPERVMTDPTRLRQILLNLTGNAVKFTEVGSVTIIARSDERDGRSRLLIDVEDTGRGLSAHEAQHIFAAFTQADGTMARKFGGTGLGLMISRRLARLMGGEISLLRSQLQQGSCFRVDIPLDPVAGCAMHASFDSDEVTPRSKIAMAPVSLRGRVLLAEDCADNQHLIAFHLRKAGAEVDVARDGAIALKLLNAADAAGKPYDLLLSDMQMPEMDGFSLARTLRSRGSTLAIVALTAHAMAEDRSKCLAAGCDDYASKPIDKAVLLAKCAEWIGRKSVGGPAPDSP